MSPHGSLNQGLKGCFQPSLPDRRERANGSCRVQREDELPGALGCKNVEAAPKHTHKRCHRNGRDFALRLGHGHNRVDTSELLNGCFQDSACSFRRDSLPENNRQLHNPVESPHPKDFRLGVVGFLPRRPTRDEVDTFAPLPAWLRLPQAASQRRSRP